MQRKEIYSAIDTERFYQQNVIGQPDERTVLAWANSVAYYAQRAMRAASYEDGNPVALFELLKAVSVGDYENVTVERGEFGVTTNRYCEDVTNWSRLDAPSYRLCHAVEVPDPPTNSRMAELEAKLQQRNQEKELLLHMLHNLGYPIEDITAETMTRAEYERREAENDWGDY